MICTTEEALKDLWCPYAGESPHNKCLGSKCAAFLSFTTNPGESFVCCGKVHSCQDIIRIFGDNFSPSYTKLP